jgi:hypothetical protein
MKCFNEICNINHNNMKKMIQKNGLRYSLIWLIVGFLSTILYPENLILNSFLGIGVLVTLGFFKLNNIKVN